MIQGILKQVAEGVGGEDGSLIFRENHNYYLAFPQKPAGQIEGFPPHLTRCGDTSTFCLNFGNHVGLFSIAGVKVRVTSKKISDGRFMELVEEIGGDFVANLLSYRGASLGFSKGKEIGTPVLYQSFMYLHSRLKRGRFRVRSNRL